jgi:CRP-like cAMP-binding protein
MNLDSKHVVPEILGRHALFTQLAEVERQQLAQGCQYQPLDRNVMLFQKGDAPKGMHLLLAGQIKLFLPHPGGAEKVVQMLDAGASFGEEGVFLDKPYAVAAQASRDSAVLFIDKYALRAAVDRNHVLAQAMMARLCNRMCELIDNMETCVQRSSTQRVAHYLAQHAPAQVERFDLHLDSDKQTIASQLNLAPETLSRVLKRLTQDGFIHSRGRTITLNNLNALRSYAG